jgi:hypothetical protein
MLNENDVKKFVSELPQGEQRILNALSSQEDWPVDDESEIKALLVKLSERLTNEESEKDLTDLPPHLTSALMANLNMSRYAIIMKELGSNEGTLEKALSEESVLTEEDRINRYTIYVRASYMVQYGLLQRIYSKDRFDEVLKILLETEKDDGSGEEDINQEVIIENIGDAENEMFE